MNAVAGRKHGATGGLSQFSSDENGTVPFGSARAAVPWGFGNRLGTVLLAAAACFAPQPSLAQAPQRDPQSDVPVMLVKNAVTAVNHGNLTGNYTVLRDLGGPAFRERNTAAQLAAIFQRLRNQKSDLSPILVLDPVFTEPPAINQAGQLVLVGFFPTRPLQVQFRLAFQRTQGGWMIDEVGVGTAQWPAPNAQAVPFGAPPAAPPANVATRPSEPYSR